VRAALLDDHVLLLLLADNNSLTGLGANNVVGHEVEGVCSVWCPASKRSLQINNNKTKSVNTSPRLSVFAHS
jgi:hypothetical protein